MGLFVFVLMLRDIGVLSFILSFGYVGFDVEWP
jgi:hypothetical protein